MRLSHVAFGASLSLTTLLLIHCGGSDPSPLEASGDAGGDGSSASDIGTSADSSVGDTKVNGPDGTVVSQGGTTDDAGPGGTTAALSCGSVSCAIPGQSCCVEQGAGGGATYSCVIGTGCPATDAGKGGDPPTALQCSGAANCGAGTVCCVEQNNNTTISSCQTSCGNGGAQLCDPKAGVSGCAAGVACLTGKIDDWGLPATFATCGGVGN